MKIRLAWPISFALTPILALAGCSSASSEPPKDLGADSGSPLAADTEAGSGPSADLDADTDDPYQGMWSGTQGSEDETWTFAGGTLTLSAAVESCTGSYVPSTGHFDLSCMPSTTAGSPPHTDDGTCTVSGTTLVCSYTYQTSGGTGSGSVTLTKLTDPYAGTWTATQGSEDETWTFSDGTLSFQASVESCSGTYTDVGHFDLSCSPLTSSGSPPHSDDGTCTFATKTTLTCSYTYTVTSGGTGQGTVTLTKE